MSDPWRSAVVLLVGLVIGCAGCDRTVPPDEDAAEAEVPEVSKTIYVVPAKDIASLGDHLPPLDDDRVEIAPPADWRPLPRSDQFLVRFYHKVQNSLPRIEIQAEEGPYEGLADVTADNVVEFAKLVARDAQQDGDLIEMPMPMRIQDVYCVRYVTKSRPAMKTGDVAAERQHLLVLHEGRLYRVNLLVRRGTIMQSKGYAYAVCGGLRFIDKLDVEETDGERGDSDRASVSP